MTKKTVHILFFPTLILSSLFLFSCTKKYDWVCTCQVYHDTTSVIETKEIKDVRKPDADRICAQFGNDVSPNNAVHECDVK